MFDVSTGLETVERNLYITAYLQHAWAISGLGLDAPVVTELRQSLDALEEEMPVVPPSVYDSVEAKYRPS